MEAKHLFFLKRYYEAACNLNCMTYNHFPKVKAKTLYCFEFLINFLKYKYVHLSNAVQQKLCRE